MKRKDAARLHLEEACKGLLYPSEEDRPFTVFESEEPPEECQIAGTVWVTPDDFFDGLDGPEWKRLRDVLEKELDNLHIGRVEGGTEIRIVLFGRSPLTGKYVGARTVSVET